VAAGQAQVPPIHAIPAGHVIPQTPQFAESLSRLVHLPPHDVAVGDIAQVCSYPSEFVIVSPLHWFRLTQLLVQALGAPTAPAVSQVATRSSQAPQPNPPHSAAPHVAVGLNIAVLHPPAKPSALNVGGVPQTRGGSVAARWPT